MRRERSKLKVRIKAAAGLLGFLLLWATPPAVLAASAYREACTMTMCVEQGFCCCLATTTEQGAEQHLETPRLLDKCPGQCAPAQVSTSYSTRDLERAPVAVFTADPDGAHQSYETLPTAIDFDGLSASPRGPPSTTLAISFSSSRQV
jgi:hypothetical protein